MSMLSAQCDNLRKMADKLAGKGTFVGYGGCVSNDALMHDSAIAMREAANTIEALSAKLQGVIGTRYCELFGAPERAARTLFEIKCGEKSCKGCPIAEPCAECDVMHDGGKALHDALLEWLVNQA